MLFQTVPLLVVFRMLSLLDQPAMSPVFSKGAKSDLDCRSDEKPEITFSATTKVAKKVIIDKSPSRNHADRVLAEGHRIAPTRCGATSV